MPYVSRNSEGRVVSVHESPAGDHSESVAATSVEILEFLLRGDSASSANANFLKSDLALIRVLEDLIEALIKKKVISIFDLPQPALDKLSLRNSLRTEYPELAAMADGEFEF